MKYRVSHCGKNSPLLDPIALPVHLLRREVENGHAPSSTFVTLEMLGKVYSALRMPSASRADGAKTFEICVSSVVPARITLGLVQKVIREEPCIILRCVLTCLGAG